MKIKVWKNPQTGKFFVTVEEGEDLYESNEEYNTQEEAEALAATMITKH